MRVQVPGSENVVNIGTRKQLFVDDHIIETTRWISPRSSETARWVQPPARPRTDLDGWSEGVDRIEEDIPGHLLRATAFVTRIINQPERYEGNPIMKKAHDWEGETAPHPNGITYDEEDEIWKMWYCGLTHEDEGRRHVYNCMYATSQDGITWDRPELGLVKDSAGNDTNIVHEGKAQFAFKDPRAGDPSRQYKMGRSMASKEGLQHPMVYYSPDGLNWTPDPGPFSHNRGDETLSVMYDPESKKYLGFCRNRYPKPTLRHRTERSLLRIQSNDLVHWSMSEPIMDKDPLDPFDTDFYGMRGTFYESVYLGFLNVHHTAKDDFDIWLAYSRDSFHWERLRTGPFLPLGPEGSWDWGMVSAIQAPIRLNDELWFYYTGVAGLHDAQGKSVGLGLAKLRVDGFASIDAFENTHRTKNYPPTLLTKPLYSHGNRLEVNVDASKGFIEAELLNVDGFPIEGYSNDECDTFKGDSLAHTFTWKGRSDIGGHLPVRVRFTMNNSKLYALQIPKG